MPAHAAKIDSGSIVKRCIEFARSIGRLPSLRELCLASNVSERRLRAAFMAVYDLPPSRFFRALMLSEARRRLVAGIEPSTSVSSVALDLGFAHFSRFSRYYQQVFGELPSATLRNSTPSYFA